MSNQLVHLPVTSSHCTLTYALIVKGLALERFGGVPCTNAQISNGERAASVAVQVICIAPQIELQVPAPYLPKCILTKTCFQRRFRLGVPVPGHEVHHP
jgi:hypothetical protein